MELLGPITNLTLISSESCNLQCKYCEIAKSSTVNHQSEAKKVRASLQSGEFLTNIKKIFEKYQVDPNDVRQIQLWGQEPTLTLDAFTEQFPKFYDYFPNLNHSFFSTNGVAYPERLVDYCKKVNDTVTRFFDVKFQFSYDGYKYTKESRGIDPDIIIDNFKKVITELNKYDWKIEIHMNLHNVITMDVMNELDTDEKILDYWKEFDYIVKELHKLNKNPTKIKISDTTSPGVINPYNASSKDGKRFYEFFKQCERLFDNDHRHPYFGMCEEFLVGYRFAKQKLNDYNESYKNILHYAILSEDLKHDNNFTIEVLSALGCAIAHGDIKVRYDGQLIHCQNAIFGLTEEDLKDKTGLRYDIQRNLLQNNSFPNLLTDNREFIEKFLYRFRVSRESFVWVYSEIVNLMVLLLKTKQIDESYNNYEKLLLHSLLLTNTFFCWDNNLQETGSLTGRTMGLIRFFANGMLDEIAKEFKEGLKIV